jgi:hypothetical protein
LFTKDRQCTATFAGLAIAGRGLPSGYHLALYRWTAPRRTLATDCG